MADTDNPLAGIFNSPTSSESKSDYFDRQKSIEAQGLIEKLQVIANQGVSFNLGGAITEDEWWDAKASPPPIVEHWFYEDVGVFIAPGGTGKTTMLLFQAVHIVLGRELFGYEVFNPGPVLILTAEDSRDSLVARLRFVCAALELDAEEIAAVRQGVIITDVSGTGFKMTTMQQQVVVPSKDVDRFIRAAEAIHPALVVIDPAVSFGVGESRVNDSEQGLIDAARLVRNRLKCGVIYIHHTGQAAARGKSLDQYSGRGGSAFADGSRMVHVLQPVDAQEWLKVTGTELEKGESGLVLARPKISYSPYQPDVYLKRKGYLFTRVDHNEDGSVVLDANAEKVWQFLNSEINEGRKWTQRKLILSPLLPTQGAIRAAVGHLKDEGRLEEAKNTDNGRGGARTYLRPIASLGPD